MDDALLGAVCEQVRPARPNGHGGGWDALAAEREQIRTWVDKGLSAVKIHTLLARRGVAVPGVPVATAEKTTFVVRGLAGR